MTNIDISNYQMKFPANRFEHSSEKVVNLLCFSNTDLAFLVPLLKISLRILKRSLVYACLSSDIREVPSARRFVCPPVLSPNEAGRAESLQDGGRQSADP